MPTKLVFNGDKGGALNRLLGILLFVYLGMSPAHAAPTLATASVPGNLVTNPNLLSKTCHITGCGDTLAFKHWCPTLNSDTQSVCLTCSACKAGSAFSGVCPCTGHNYVCVIACASSTGTGCAASHGRLGVKQVIDVCPGRTYQISYMTQSCSPTTTAHAGPCGVAGACVEATLTFGGVTRGFCWVTSCLNGSGVGTTYGSGCPGCFTPGPVPTCFDFSFCVTAPATACGTNFFLCGSQLETNLVFFAAANAGVSVGGSISGSYTARAEVDPTLAVVLQPLAGGGAPELDTGSARCAVALMLSLLCVTERRRRAV